MKIATVKSLLLPYCTIGLHKGGRGAHYLAHYSYNSTRLSSDTITMEEKLYDPCKMENVCDKHELELNKTFLMQYSLMKTTPFQRKEESPKNQGLRQSCIA